MANNSNKKKAVRWSQADEDMLIKNVEKHVLCLKKAFEKTSLELQRSPKAVATHWYNKTSKNCGRTLFMTVSSSHVAVNRKNSKGTPLRATLYRRLLSILRLRY